MLKASALRHFSRRARRLLRPDGEVRALEGRRPQRLHRSRRLQALHRRSRAGIRDGIEAASHGQGTDGALPRARRCVPACKIKPETRLTPALEATCFTGCSTKSSFRSFTRSASSATSRSGLRLPPDGAADRAVHRPVGDPEAARIPDRPVRSRRRAADPPEEDGYAHHGRRADWDRDSVADDSVVRSRQSLCLGHGLFDPGIRSHRLRGRLHQGRPRGAVSA